MINSQNSLPKKWGLEYLTYGFSIFLITLISCDSSSVENQDEPDPEPNIPEVIQAKGYYLSKNGDDANPGTQEKPWRSLDRINSVDLEPGETVFLEGGATFTGTLILDSLDSGSKEKPVTVTSYGNGAATIDGNTKESAIIMANFFKFKGVNAIGLGRKNGNTSNGIHVERASNGSIEQVTIEGFQHSGLLLYSCKNIEALRVVAKNNGYSGIYISSPFIQKEGRFTFPDTERDLSRNITIKDCLAENNPGDPSVLNNHSGSGIFVEYTKGALIDHCVATNNGWDMPRSGNGPVGIWAHSSDSVTIQYSISYRNKTSQRGHDGGGFTFDGGVTNSVIQYCLSYENEGAGYGFYQFTGAMDWSNNTLRYSISINDAVNGTKSVIKYAGITFWNGTNSSRQFTNCQIYHNVFSNNISPIIIFKGNSKKDFGFYNNIFVGKGELINGPSSEDIFLGNTYWGVYESIITINGYKTLQELANATGQEKLEGKLVGKQIDPLLNTPLNFTITDPYQLKSLTNFKLQPNSPLKDQGLDLQTLFKIKLPPYDFYGNNVFKGTAPEPGVHEMD